MAGLIAKLHRKGTLKASASDLSAINLSDRDIPELRDHDVVSNWIYV